MRNSCRCCRAMSPSGTLLPRSGCPPRGSSGVSCPRRRSMRRRSTLNRVVRQPDAATPPPTRAPACCAARVPSCENGTLDTSSGVHPARRSPARGHAPAGRRDRIRGGRSGGRSGTGSHRARRPAGGSPATATSAAAGRDDDSPGHHAARPEINRQGPQGRRGCHESRRGTPSWNTRITRHVWPRGTPLRTTHTSRLLLPWMEIYPTSAWRRPRG